MGPEESVSVRHAGVRLIKHGKLVRFLCHSYLAGGPARPHADRRIRATPCYAMIGQERTRLLDIGRA